MSNEKFVSYDDLVGLTLQQLRLTRSKSLKDMECALSMDHNSWVAIETGWSSLTFADAEVACKEAGGIPLKTFIDSVHKLTDHCEAAGYTIYYFNKAESEKTLTSPSELRTLVTPVLMAADFI